MDEKNEMGQAVNIEQYLQELRQRINAKAERLAKINLKKGVYWGIKPKNRWISIVALVFLVALYVGLEVLSYVGNIFWEFNAWLIGFLLLGFVVFVIMSMIMRYFLAKMKKADTTPQYYRAVKQFINTHKLRFWVPVVVALICDNIVRHGLEDLGTYSFVLRVSACIGCVIGIVAGASKYNWYLDEGFRNDLEELGDYV